MTNLLTALNITWLPVGNLPVGLGVNVHSQLVPVKFLKPLFDWVRFDLSGKDHTTQSLQAADKHYKEAGCTILWLVSDAADVQSLATAGIRNACVEGINEPDGSFPGRPAFTPANYIVALNSILQVCKKNSYSLVGGSIASWGNIGYMLSLASYGLPYFVDAISTHPYGIQTNHQLWDNITMQRQAWPKSKPFGYTEFSITQGELLDMEDYDPDIMSFYQVDRVEKQAAVLGSIAKQAMFEKVFFCLYDMPSTDPYIQLLDNSGTDFSQAKPSKLYNNLMRFLLPNSYQEWFNATQTTTS